MNVELNLSDEQLQSIIHNAIQKEVKKRIEECTGGRYGNEVFNRANIEQMAREIITEQYLPKMNVKFAGELKIDFKELARVMTESVETYFADTVEAKLTDVEAEEEDD